MKVVDFIGIFKNRPRITNPRVQVILVLAHLSLVTSCGQAEFAGGSSRPPAPPQTVNPAPRPATDPVAPKPAPSTEVVFGADKVFHIGDNDYSGSSCKSEIDTYELSGNKYFFQFEVLEPATVLSVVINTVCGIDYAQSNASFIIKDTTMGPGVLLRQPVVVGTDNIQFSSLTLEPGHYAVVVQSAAKITNPNAGDHDDFLVGNITLKASKKIQGGDVRTE